MGSSPRVRGRPLPLWPSAFRRGLIPASAGQTSSANASRASARAHPRECGADQSVVSVRMRHRGSSPRVRGRLRLVCHGVPLQGLIPASAGQTLFPVGGHPLAGAHPRECGADRYFGDRLGKAVGSSPRVRGRHVCKTCVSGARGLIPASAGQTVAVPTPRPERWAHPRECGADATHLQHGCRSAGSSPRVRGRRVWRVRLPLFSGLIPASAGQTFPGGSSAPALPAHPRECGADGLW